MKPNAIRGAIMSRFEHLPLYRKTYLLMKEIYLITKQFPKEYKYSLGEEILNKSWKLLDLIIETNSATEKYNKISELSLEFDKLKLRIRFAFEIKLIPEKRFLNLQEKIAEIGEMIGGWLKWAEKKD